MREDNITPTVLSIIENNQINKMVWIKGVLLKMV